MSIRIFLTGRVAIEADGLVVGDERHLRGKQGRLAFSYLVNERTRPVSRGELANIVWPEQMPQSWEVSLSALMSRLHSTLSADALRVQGVSLARGFGNYQLLLPVDAWIDLEAGFSAIDAAEGALRNGNSKRVLGPATVAATIARRPFLAGVGGEWADSQRGKLERQLVRALDCLSQMWLSADEPALAIETAMEAIAIDPFREISHQLLMRSHVAIGNPSEAVRVYHRLRELLAEELGTDPSNETESLYVELLG